MLAGAVTRVSGGKIWKAEQVAPFALRGPPGFVRPATVEAVDRLAPDVGVRLVQSPRLPGVDEIVRVLGVGVAPLVRGDVVGGEPGAEGNE